MSKIMFFNIPAHGHTNPTLALVSELASRGHSIFYYSSLKFQKDIEAAGAVFMDIGSSELPQPTDEDGDKIGSDLGYAAGLIVDMTLALDERISKDIADIKPDCIVADSVAYWGKLAAKKFSLPFVSSTTTFAFNRYSAGAISRPKGGMLKMLLSIPGINRSLGRLRERGYPVKSILDIIQNDNDTNTIVYTSREFQPFSETFSDRYAFVGPLPREKTEEFKSDGRKTVYISLGTVNNKNSRFYENCIKAFSGENVRVVMSVGQRTDENSFSDVPANIELHTRVDQMAVLEAADVFITHCGMNSASEGLYCGVPLVLFPQTPEQGAVAGRVKELGAGEYLEDIEPKCIKSTVFRIMADGKIKSASEKISAGFKTAGGAKAAADMVERVIKES